MTKGQAIAYAQITLNFIKNPDNNVKLTLKNFRNFVDFFTSINL